MERSSTSRRGLWTATATVVSDASGRYRALLPADGYAVNAMKTGTENGMSVT